MTSPTIFDQTEPTVLAELERRLNNMKFNNPKTNWKIGYNEAIQDALNELELLKPAEIDQLRKAFAEGGGIPQSAESWVNKFNQGGC